VATKYGTPFNMLQNAIMNALAHPLSGAPSSPVFGQFYTDSTLNAFGVYMGATTGWIYLTATEGSVTTVSVVNANGFAGTVANAGTAPALTLQTTISGLLKGNGTAIAAAAAGTDYLAPGGSGAALTGLTQSQISGLAAALAALAPLASPALTGTPTAPAPTTASSIAIKSYVDGLFQGAAGKYGAVACTTGAETCTVTSGTVTQISGTAVDGVSPAIGDNVLIMNAPAATGPGTAATNGLGTAQPANGLYTVTNATTNLTLSRAADFTGSNSPIGAYVFVAGGTLNKGTGFIVVAPVPETVVTYGTTAIQFQQFTGAGEVSVGAGLALTGNQVGVVAGGLPVAQGGMGATTVAGAKTSLSFGQVYTSGTLGNGALTTLTVTHNLNNSYPDVTVWDVSGANPQIMYCDVIATSANAVNLVFGAAPAANTVRCTVVG
jgi:hypothetical protein